jgi:hypothetical protein
MDTFILKHAALSAVFAGLLSIAPSGASAATTRLSDEVTVSRWAEPRQRAAVRRRPVPGAPRVARLQLRTEDGFPEVYLLLEQLVDPAGRTWIKVRVPMRPNGTTGWVRRSTLDAFHVNRRRLVVDRHTLRATLYRRGRVIFRAPVGVGKPSTPTPGGFFWVREKFVVNGGRGLYGPRAFGTAAYAVLSDWPGGGVVGIHGTGEPWLIPGRPSHGCIRMRNRDIRRLFRLMPRGTPIRIR